MSSISAKFLLTEPESKHLMTYFTTNLQ